MKPGGTDVPPGALRPSSEPTFHDHCAMTAHVSPAPRQPDAALDVRAETFGDLLGNQVADRFAPNAARPAATAT